MKAVAHHQTRIAQANEGQWSWTSPDPTSESGGWALVRAVDRVPVE